MAKNEVNYIRRYPNGITEVVRGTPSAVAEYRFLLSQKTKELAAQIPVTKEEKQFDEARDESVCVESSKHTGIKFEDRQSPVFSGRHPVLCVTNGKIYKTQKDAEIELGLVRWSIKNCFLKGRNSVGKYIFKSLKKSPRKEEQRRLFSL